MIEWLLLGLPVAVTALVFSLAITTDPHDLIMRRITTPDSIAQRGYPTEALADLLQDEIFKITDGATSSHHEHRIEIGTDDTTADQFANIVNVLQPIRATQRLLGMVSHIADITIVEHADKTVVAHLRILAGDYAGTLELTKTITVETPFEATMSGIAREVVGVAEPYVMAAHLYNTAVNGPGAADFDATMKFLKQWLPNVEPQDRPWAYNLLGLIAARSSAPELAIAQYQEALIWQPDFAPAQANWGRLLQESEDLQGAIEHYRTALSLNPELAIARTYLAEALLAEQRFEPALAQLDQARALAPELARNYEIQATLYEDAGLPDLAKSERDRAQLARIRQPRQTYYDAM